MIYIPLNKQINVYSVDTGAFYSNKELYLHKKISKIRRENKHLIELIENYEKKLNSYGVSYKDENPLDKLDLAELGSEGISICEFYLQVIHMTQEIKKHKSNLITKTKNKLLTLLHNKTNANIITDGKHHQRVLKGDLLSIKSIVSIFDSSLTRMLLLEEDELSNDTIIVKTFYFDVLKDIVLHGFTYAGERYLFFTASAGQIRTKKTVFVKESVWYAHSKTLMCGLDIATINKKGGNNVNKHLAYLALSNSATELWEEFNIDKTIVIDDFETEVVGTVDYIDESDYSITRKTMPVPISHTDGVGMVLPSLSKVNGMFRAPWIKGLLGVFDFRKWIRTHPNASPTIIDIYGKEHDVIKEDIQIIFTKSQFKMWKYYDSWDEYKKYFKMYNCSAGRCNVEEEKISNAHFNYQMLQTLTKMTDDELKTICKKSNTKLKNITSDLNTMHGIFGVSENNVNQTALQQALKIYPELYGDPYVKNVTKQIKDSLIKSYKSGKLEVNGKYTFILPDLYAVCEYWFCGVKEPVGLLNDGEVSCRLFKNSPKLDCLRSPHLYIEHAIRQNIIDVYKARWFTTDAVYTSCHDLISKILQFDVDGDKSLVVADKTIIEVAERCTQDVVPLYYNMKKASSVPLNNMSIYEGLQAAYTGGNIGLYSNNISKIWNSDIFINGTEDEQKAAMDIIKLLCCENNFVIDYAKTLYKPARPKEIHNKIISFTKAKVPYFFKYAKDKEETAVADKNTCLVNKLDDIIISPRLQFDKNIFGKLNYQNLMSGSPTTLDSEFLKKFDELNQSYHFKLRMQDENNNNLKPLGQMIRNDLSCFGYSDVEITDQLIEYLYSKETKHKELLWFCYGNIIVENLQRNIEDKPICPKCGSRFIPDHFNQQKCPVCLEKEKLKAEMPKVKKIRCEDCGKTFEVALSNNSKIRCDECQNNVRKVERMKRFYEKSNKENRIVNHIRGVFLVEPKCEKLILQGYEFSNVRKMEKPTQKYDYYIDMVDLKNEIGKTIQLKGKRIHNRVILDWLVPITQQNIKFENGSKTIKLVSQVK